MYGEIRMSAKAPLKEGEKGYERSCVKKSCQRTLDSNTLLGIAFARLKVRPDFAMIKQNDEKEEIILYTGDLNGCLKNKSFF